MKKTALEKFLRYAKIDTQSKEDVDITPSTEKQFNLARLLAEELQSFGIKDAHCDEYCYVYATIPSNIPADDAAFGNVPNIAFIAHVDTSPDVTDENVNPQVIENYDGSDIVLPADNNVVLTTKDYPNLLKCVGHTIVTTDGTTLLGADNKAGVAEIMTAAEYLMNHPEIIHGEVRVCFTPDEEVGKGTEKISLDKLNVKYAYTVDGDLPGELNNETFSANGAVITAYGRDIHPGFGKNIMVNAARVIADIVAKLPREMSPECTEGYEPYIHPHTIEGGVAKSSVKFLLRDFRTEGLDDQKVILEKIIEEVQPLHPRAKIELKIIEMYRNMREVVDHNPIVTEAMWEAAIRSGVTPHWVPIRGGTDGSRLTSMGIPCPNIYTGGQNFHSRTEWLDADAMEKSVNTIINIAQIYVEKAR